MTTTEPIPCHVCRTGALLEFSEYPALSRVTSDVKPWPAGGRLAVCRACGTIQKILDPKWHTEAAKVYREYSLYHNAGGTEQHIFANGGQPVTRSSRLIEQLRDRVGLGERGRLLDIGCGNGGMLRSFSRLLPNWTLAGTELDDKTRAVIEAIPGVEKLYTGEIEEIPGEFDAISLLHVLEHVPDPVSLLLRLVRKLRPGGLLIVDVPDYSRNPFDLAITDHCNHFSAETLAAVFRAAGLDLTATGGDIVPKELVAVGRPGGAAVPLGSGMVDLAGISAAVQVRLAWLGDLAAAGRAGAAAGRFGVFGTSTAGAWLLGELGAGIEFFVDEDRAKIGQTWAGRPILAPNAIPPESTVFLGLVPAMAAGVYARLATPGQFQLPPELKAA